MIHPLCRAGVGERGSFFFFVVILRKELSVDSDIIWEKAD